MNKAIIITCEHAGNKVPEHYRYLFKNKEYILETHRGYDIGALELAETCAREMRITPYNHFVSRLIIDLNRSLHNPSAFSEFVHHLDDKEKQSIIKTYYEPHRKEVEQEISNFIGTGGYLLHLGVHTFTPELNGTVRNTDIGLLYDPARPKEKEFCEIWKTLLEERSDLKIRFNYPYLGVMDGFSTYLRKQFSSAHYSGIEIEVNQKFPRGNDPDQWEHIQGVIGETLRETFDQWN